MRGISLLLSFLILLSLFTPYSITLTKADIVYFDNTFLNLSFNPGTIKESGYVYLDFKLKKTVNDNLDFIFGFNTTNMKPKFIEIWQNVSHTYKTENYQNQTLPNGTIRRVFTGYTTIVKWFFDWAPLNKDFVVYNFNYENMTKWFSIEDVNIVVNKTYKVRFYVNVKINTHGKYWFVIKPTSLTFHEAYTSNKFFALDPWFDSNWDYRVSVWVDQTKIDNSLIDFPVAFYVNTTICDTYAKKNLSDFRFLAEDNATQYAWQIEYNASGQTRVIWVKIPYVYGSVNTLVNFYFGYSGAGFCANTSNVTNIWTNSNIKGSYLCNEPTGSLKDNKRFIYFTAAATPTYLQGGQNGFGKCIYIDSDNDYFSAGSNFSIYDGGGFSYWFKGVGDVGEGGLSIPYSTSGSGWQGIFNANGTIRMKTLNTASTEKEIYSTAGTSLFNGAWVHIAMIYDKAATTQYLYVNGSVVKSCSQTLNIRNSHYTTYIGAFSSSYKTAANSLHGYFDSVMMYSSVVNASWVKAEYNSGKNTLLIWGDINFKNNIPVIQSIDPANGSTNIPLNPLIMAEFLDADLDLMRVCFFTNASGVWVNIVNEFPVGDGDFVIFPSTFSSGLTSYWWAISCFDGTANVSVVLHFTTTENVIPDQNYHDKVITVLIWYVNISDNSNLFSFNISCNNSEFSYRKGMTNNTYDIELHDLIFGCNYTVSVNVNDSGGNWNNKTYYVDLNFSGSSGASNLIVVNNKFVLGLTLGGVMFSIIAIVVFKKRRDSNE